MFEDLICMQWCIRLVLFKWIHSMCTCIFITVELLINYHCVSIHVQLIRTELQQSLKRWQKTERIMSKRPGWRTTLSDGPGTRGRRTQRCVTSGPCPHNLRTPNSSQVSYRRDWSNSTLKRYARFLVHKQSLQCTKIRTEFLNASLTVYE